MILWRKVPLQFGVMSLCVFTFFTAMSSLFIPNWNHVHIFAWTTWAMIVILSPMYRMHDAIQPSWRAHAWLCCVMVIIPWLIFAAFVVDDWERYATWEQVYVCYAIGDVLLCAICCMCCPTTQPEIMLSEITFTTELVLTEHDMTERECAICLEPLSTALPATRATSQCTHAYHMPCIRRWFQYSQTCPLCRTPH